MKQKISQFEFAIMETITPEEAKKFEPRTDVDELNFRQKNLLSQVKNLSIHNVVGQSEQLPQKECPYCDKDEINMIDEDSNYCKDCGW